MFTIDLLHGRGVPISNRPEGVAILAAAVAIAVVVAITMFGVYVNTGIAMSIQQQEIVNYENKIANLSGEVKLQESFTQNKESLNGAISEVGSSLSRHMQWSPILAVLVENLPEAMIMTELEAKQKYVKTEVPKKDSPHETVDVLFVVRTLIINLSGSPSSNCDEAVKEYMERLRVSELLGPKLENTKVSQKADILNGQNVIAYEIHCNLKPQR